MIQFRKNKDGKSHPITEKKGRSNHNTGQEGDPSWKKSSLEDLKKDEKQSSKKYLEMSKTAPTKYDASKAKKMSQDEAKHYQYLAAAENDISVQKKIEGSK